MVSLSMKGHLEGKNSLLSCINGLRNGREDLILVHNFYSAPDLIPAMVFSDSILYIFKLWTLHIDRYDSIWPQ